jgi:hypothetical protein
MSGDFSAAWSKAIQDAERQGKIRHTHACAAMQSLILRDSLFVFDKENIASMAELCFEIADAMMEASKK